MPGTSRLTTCRECGKVLHLRGLASHIAFKHPSPQIPMALDAERRRDPVVATRPHGERPEIPKEIPKEIPSGAGIKGITEIPEIALAEIPEITLPAKLAEKRKSGVGLILGVLAVAALWLSRKKPPDADDAAETKEERQGSHLGRGIGGYKG